ncbi:MAG: ShlB/FhaC/HecB family hemolysin secretion/activation protein [Thiobacillaceae bacterium]|nr:ShlB/FhaC/HecB family hemolysin secretion/activation protein [Thiobacillaceae bacterium]
MSQTRQGTVQLPTVEQTAAHPTEEGPRVLLRNVHFEGNRLIPSEELLGALGDYAGKPYNLPELQGLALRVQAYYHARGYPFVHVAIPPQNLAAGILRMTIVEAHYGRIEAQGEPMVAARAQDFLSALVPGEPIRADTLERALLNLSDLPGIYIAPSIGPGERFGTSDLLVNVRRVPERRVELSADNHGNRYAGAYRLQAGLVWDSPFTFGDRAGARLIYTDEGMWFGGMDYSLPLGARGWRARLSYTHTDYTLGEQFAALGAEGQAQVLQVGLNYPLIRTARHSLYLQADLTHKRLLDEYTATQTVLRKHSTTLPLALTYERPLALAGGSSLGCVLTPGHIHYDATLTAADIASNAARRGGFIKLACDLTHAQPLAPSGWFAHLRLGLQWAGKNLDSSEKYAMGGSQGVRAYPQGEGNGDHALLGQIELSYPLAQGLTPFIFYDLGKSWLNAEAGRISPAVTNNTRTLSGGGLGVRLTGKGWGMGLMAAWRGEGSPPQTDPRDQRPRLWWRLHYTF